MFLMSVPELNHFIILRENENMYTNGDQEYNICSIKTEKLKPQIGLNKIQYFSKSYHIGCIHLE